jgi:rRNA-processing protein FCF1
MQSWFIAWLALPVVVLFLSLFAFYLATAALMVWLTFRSPLSGRIQSFKGVVAPFFGSTAIIFGLLLAFLSNDIWDRNKQAARIVLIESNTLVALYSLSAASGADNSRLRSAIRAYVTAVVQDEWPRLARQQRSATTDAALNVLLREVAQTGASKDADIRKALLDMVLRIRDAHEDRVELSNDRTAVSKWAAVLLLALVTQLAIAVVHLERPRPQIAALFIFTLAAVSVLGLLAIHEAPFEPPVFVPPGPIGDVLQQVPI